MNRSMTSFPCRALLARISSGSIPSIPLLPLDVNEGRPKLAHVHRNLDVLQTDQAKRDIGHQCHRPHRELSVPFLAHTEEMAGSSVLLSPVEMVIQCIHYQQSGSLDFQDDDDLVDWTLVSHRQRRGVW